MIKTYTFYFTGVPCHGIWLRQYQIGDFKKKFSQALEFSRLFTRRFFFERICCMVSFIKHSKVKETLSVTCLFCLFNYEIKILLPDFKVFCMEVLPNHHLHNCVLKPDLGSKDPMPISL